MLILATYIQNTQTNCNQFDIPRYELMYVLGSPTLWCMSLLERQPLLRM